MDSYSPNMLKTFKTCPQKFYYKYIQNISIPQKTSFFEKGKKIHALANYHLKGFDISKLEKALTLPELEIWESLKKNEFFQKNYVNSEYNLSCRLNDFWIGGRLDAVVKDENAYYILDYKTGSIPKNPEYDYQTMVYLLCLDKKLEQTNQKAQIKFVYIDLKNNQNCVIDFDENRRQKYQQRIIEMYNKIKQTELPQEIEHSDICDLCEYRKICI